MREHAVPLPGFVCLELNLTPWLHSLLIQPMSSTSLEQHLRLLPAGTYTQPNSKHCLWDLPLSCPSSGARGPGQVSTQYQLKEKIFNSKPRNISWRTSPKTHCVSQLWVVVTYEELGRTQTEKRMYPFFLKNKKRNKVFISETQRLQILKLLKEKCISINWFNTLGIKAELLSTFHSLAHQAHYLSSIP